MNRIKNDINNAKIERRLSRTTSIFEHSLVKTAIKQSIMMLSPRTMVRNPVMFVTEIGAFLTTLILIQNFSRNADNIFYNFIICLILWLTVTFANFAEALAEARGRAQTDTLRRTRQKTAARKINAHGINIVQSDELLEGDIVLVLEGEIIPSDGEVIEGVALVDESAITGESAPVVREAGGDRSGVTGGTKVLSDQIKVLVTAGAGASFLDRMIEMVEGTKRRKTPNETALTITLAGLTLAFLMVTCALLPIGRYFGAVIPIPILISLLVCLIPTTIGALLAAIGLAGMDRALSANILAKSGKAVELAGDIDMLLLDKTGTITIGDRQATGFHPLPGIREDQLINAAIRASSGDQTPEGRSIVNYCAKMLGINAHSETVSGDETIPFTAHTRLSGTNASDGKRYRKGAADAMRDYITSIEGNVPDTLKTIVDSIAREGKTPIIVSEDKEVLGVIELSDVLKPGIHERFKRLRAMGLRIVMVTGDNPLTAESIAKDAGVNDYIAEAKPEDKLDYIRREQRAGRLVAMMGDGTNDAPALAQADIGVAMNSGTQAAKEAGNMIDLDSDPSKLIEVIEIGKQLLMTRGALTTFSIANDIAKYFAIIPAMFSLTIPQLASLNILKLTTPQSAILSALIFNALIIPLLIPIAIKGVKYRPMGADAILRKNLLIYGFGGVVMPFIGIKLIDVFLTALGLF